DSSGVRSRSSATEAGGSGAKELDIFGLPRDPERLALLPAELRVAVTRQLGEHPVSACVQVELDEVAEVLDEDDLAGRAVLGRAAVALVDRHGGRAHGDERGVADGGRVARHEHGGADEAAVLD